MPEQWNITAKKRLIEMEMSRKALADAIGVNYSVVCAVLGGKVIRETVREKICAFLDMKEVKK